MRTSFDEFRDKVWAYTKAEYNYTQDLFLGLVLKKGFDSNEALNVIENTIKNGIEDSVCNVSANVVALMDYYLIKEGKKDASMEG